MLEGVKKLYLYGNPTYKALIFIIYTFVRSSGRHNAIEKDFNKVISKVRISIKHFLR
jgi:hypothetical protein